MERAPDIYGLGWTLCFLIFVGSQKNSIELRSVACSPLPSTTWITTLFCSRRGSEYPYLSTPSSPTRTPPAWSSLCSGGISALRGKLRQGGARAETWLGRERCRTPRPRCLL